MLVLAFSLLVSAGPKPKATPPRPPPVVKSPNKALPPEDPSATAATLLTQVQALYDSLEYDQVGPLTERLLAREDLTLEQRLEAFRLQGSAKAIVEDPVDAEKPFRLLLRTRVDYELPANTPPKILAVFRKVQSEEVALANQLRDVERSRLVANLKILGEPPQQAKGGLPLKFSFRLRDPTSAVVSVRVPYRRAGQPAFSLLALERSEDGDWRGAIPGDLTADEKGFVLEYAIETADAAGPLITLGSQVAPRTIEILPGQVPAARFKPIHPAVFGTSVGLTAALGVAAGILGVSLAGSQRSYYALVAREGPIDGRLINQRVAEGELLATLTNAAWISSLSMLAVTLLLLPFTDFGVTE